MIKLFMDYLYSLSTLLFSIEMFLLNLSIVSSRSELYGIICDTFRENQLFSIVHQNMVEFSKVIQ